jgi:hypothetical protein
MSDPVICFGRIVYFCHDSDHDYRETTTPRGDLKTGEVKRLTAADFCLDMYRRLLLHRGGDQYLELPDRATGHAPALDAVGRPRASRHL